VHHQGSLVSCPTTGQTVERVLQPFTTRYKGCIEGGAELAWELFLSLHAVRERLAHVEAELEVRTAGGAVARALRESL
jgi:hypothetical protein